MYPLRAGVDLGMDLGMDLDMDLDMDFEPIIVDLLAHHCRDDPSPFLAEHMLATNVKVRDTLRREKSTLCFQLLRDGLAGGVCD